MFDLPPSVAAGEIPQQCVMAVVQKYQIPPSLIVGLLAQEGGRIGTASPNSNGTYDYGPAQINSAWLKTIQPYGVTARSLQYNACMNLWVSGWIMRRCMNKFHTNQSLAIGCYHVGENPRTEQHYRRMYAYALKIQTQSSKYSAGFQRWLQTPAIASR